MADAFTPDDLPACRGTDGRMCPGPRICDHDDCHEGYDLRGTRLPDTDNSEVAS